MPPWLALPPLLLWWLTRWPAGPVAEATWSRPLARPVLRTRDAVIEPFAAFFRDHGSWALMMLLAISLYRLPDFVLGPMANPFYADLGIDKETVGDGARHVRPGGDDRRHRRRGPERAALRRSPTLLAGAVLGPGSNLAFSYLALHGADAGRVHGGDGDRQLLQRFRRRGAGRLHVQPHQCRLHRHPVRAAQFVLRAAGQGAQGLLRRGRSSTWRSAAACWRRTRCSSSAPPWSASPALLLCLLLVLRKPDRRRRSPGRLKADIRRAAELREGCGAMTDIVLRDIDPVLAERIKPLSPTRVAGPCTTRLMHLLEQGLFACESRRPARFDDREPRLAGSDRGAGGRADDPGFGLIGRVGRQEAPPRLAANSTWTARRHRRRQASAGRDRPRRARAARARR